MVLAKVRAFCNLRMCSSDSVWFLIFELGRC